LLAVIVALNSKYIHSSLAPWYLLAGVEAYCKEPVTAAVVEGTINMELRDAAVRIVGQSPDVIGLGCYIWNITFIKKLLPLLKEARPEAVIVLGGPEVSYNAGEILNGEPLVDFVLAGEGELPFALLLDALATGSPPDDIPGLCFRRGGDSIVSPPFCSSEDPPNPYTAAYLAALGGRIAYLETSRGCPFSCAFCLSGRNQRALRAGSSVWYFDLDRAKCDILLLANSETQTVKFVDRTFNDNRERAREIFRFILDTIGTAVPKGVRFHFEIAGDLLDEETLTLLKSAPKGLFQLEIGLQSFNEKALAAVRRKTDIPRLRENIARLVSFGNIHIHIDLIAGLPFEDMASFAEGFNTAYALMPHMLQLGFLKLLHGAALREEPRPYPCRYSPNPPYEVLETRWMTEAELRRLRHTEEALARLHNSGRFRRTLRTILERTGWTAFELFTAAGDFLAERDIHQMSLDDFTALIFGWFRTDASADASADALRDAMVCDRLAAGVRIPDCLRIDDPRLKQVMTAINAGERTRLPKGVKRRFALLYAENTVVWADNTERDPVTGEYRLNTAPL
jgi:radical SAM superfamily enzyme YgiQ (UPF0313 family)